MVWSDQGGAREGIGLELGIETTKHSSPLREGREKHTLCSGKLQSLRPKLRFRVSHQETRTIVFI